MTLTLKELKKIPHQTERKYVKVQKGSGLYLVVENLKNKCKRFEGMMRYPKGSTTNTRVYFPVLGKEIKRQEDLNKLIKLWDDIKTWSKSTGKNPNDYFTKDEIVKSQVTLKELFDEFLEHLKLTKSNRTYVDRKNKLNQIIRYFGEETSVTDLEWDNGGRRKMKTFLQTIKSRGKHNHTIRIRSLLNQCFHYGEKNQLFTRGQNPCIDKFDFEEIGYTPRSNPSIKWEEVPELFEKVNSSSNSIITINQ